MIGLGAGVGALALGAGAGGRAAAAPRRHPPGPNVLYVTADDLGTRLGAYGHPLVSSPRIDAFAEHALLFERAYCQVAICGASRTSILTGLRPETTGVLGNTEQWRTAAPQAVTLGRHFRDAGYRTYAIGKINDRRNGKLDDAWVEQPDERGLHDTVAARALMRHVDRTADGSPFFLAIGFAAPHCPWAPTAPSLARYAGIDVMSEVGPEHSTSGAFIHQCTPQTSPGADGPERLPLSDTQVVDIVRRYLASVTDVDTMFGEILDSAHHLGMLEDTIVIFWSGDHGFSLGDNGQWGKWSNADSATRIPLIMSVPGTRAGGRRAGGLVEAVDMYPTLDELCGLGAPPQALDGLSFAPLFDDPGRPWKKGAFTRWGRGETSVKTERYNFIVNWGYGTTVLYDLQEDPHETTNIAAARPDVVTELRALLAAGPDAARPD